MSIPGSPAHSSLSVCLLTVDYHVDVGLTIKDANYPRQDSQPEDICSYMPPDSNLRKTGQKRENIDIYMNRKRSKADAFVSKCTPANAFKIPM